MPFATPDLLPEQFAFETLPADEAPHNQPDRGSGV